MSDAKEETRDPEAPVDAGAPETATRDESAAAPEPSATAEDGAAPAPKKKKKKKKRKAESGADAQPDEALQDGEPELDATGAERPRFHAWFPRDEELDRLVRAFEVGNYALVRERAPKLAEGAENEKVRAAARELLARIEPDPLMKYLLLAATLLLVFLAFYAYRAHGH